MIISEQEMVSIVRTYVYVQLMIMMIAFIIIAVIYGNFFAFQFLSDSSISLGRKWQLYCFVLYQYQYSAVVFNLAFFSILIPGTPINRLPIMAKQVLDLYELYNLVIARGGLVEVIHKKLWQEVIKGLGLPSSITSAAFTLRTQ